MNFLDKIYRAFLEYRKETSDDRECASNRRDVARIDADKDCVEVTRVVCDIENDWIEAIEEGLVHVERALAEERQFIRADGETIPIEKVKRVSRDSVEHLSKHSNLITKKTEGKDLVPEKLYTVERQNDYAVYENRFLYMLLCYLSDFIGMRYTRILEHTNTYRGTLRLDKTVSSRQNKIKFKVALDEKRRDDPIMMELNPNKPIIERIGMLLKTVDHYLNTPLMEEVAKAPKLKPPITKTNVLKMDKNFKGAVALYDFITSYDRKGYTVTPVVKKQTFTEQTADEFAELYALSSFLTYEYGMGIKDVLKENYSAEEDRRKAAEEQRRLEQLRRLKKRVAESGLSTDEYILELEKQLRAFNGIYTRLDDALTEVSRLVDENDELKATAAALNERIDELGGEIAELEQKHEQEIAELNAAHTAEVAALNASYTEQISGLRAEFGRQIEELNANCQAQIDYVKTQCAEELADKTAEFDRDMAALRTSHAEEVFALKTECKKQISDKQTELDKVKAEAAATEEKCRKESAASAAAVREAKAEADRLRSIKEINDGRFNALRFSQGLMTDADDFTSEEAFDEIEKQYEAFKKFFKGEWKKAKKKIRAEALHGEPPDDGEGGDE